MRNFITGIFAALVGAAGLGAIAWIVVLPRIDWGPSNPPGAVEKVLAPSVLHRWIHRNARPGKNPFRSYSRKSQGGTDRVRGTLCRLSRARRQRSLAISLKQSSVHPWQS
jgi:hypothetical protein